jgi:hypothetical protein
VHPCVLPDPRILDFIIEYDVNCGFVITPKITKLLEEKKSGKSFTTLDLTVASWMQFPKHQHQQTNGKFDYINNTIHIDKEAYITRVNICNSYI